MVEHIFLHHKWKEVRLFIKIGLYELPLKLLNDLGLRILRNQKISGKSQSFTELLPSTYSSSRNENFVSTIKKLLRNRNCTFTVMHYFTYKLELVSNIL